MLPLAVSTLPAAMPTTSRPTPLIWTALRNATVAPNGFAVAEGVTVAVAVGLVSLGVRVAGVSTGVPGVTDPGARVGVGVGEAKVPRTDGVGVSVARTVPRGVRVQVGVRVGRGVAASAAAMSQEQQAAQMTNPTAAQCAAVVP